ncbi:MAG: alpha/beta fold hydrolase [Burkholderiaceae bacterium]|nr:alpha/beta fold hydrolase [Burkholderiaceae bacterium]
MKTATVLRLWLAALMAAGAALAAWLLPAPAAPWAMLAALALPPAFIAVVLALEFLLAALFDPRQPRLPAARWLAIWAHQVWGPWRMSCIAQPFLAGFPEPPWQHDPRRPAVLLVHGYLCNRAVWRPLLASGALAHANVATVNLEPVFGAIDRYAEQIAGAVARLRAASGTAQVILVGHSMGGIAIRAYLRRYGDAQVARVITIASPHQGTLLGRIGHGVNARQMARGSRYLQGLEAALTPALRGKLVCLATRDDNMIIPRTSPLLPGARHLVFEGVGHLAMVVDRRVWAALAESVADIPARSFQRSIGSAT